MMINHFVTISHSGDHRVAYYYHAYEKIECHCCFVKALKLKNRLKDGGWSAVLKDKICNWNFEIDIPNSASSFYVPRRRRQGHPWREEKTPGISVLREIRCILTSHVISAEPRASCGMVSQPGILLVEDVSRWERDCQECGRVLCRD